LIVIKKYMAKVSLVRLLASVRCVTTTACVRRVPLLGKLVLPALAAGVGFKLESVPAAPVGVAEDELPRADPPSTDCAPGVTTACLAAATMAP
jgi:hypothetical protein